MARRVIPCGLEHVRIRGIRVVDLVEHVSARARRLQTQALRSGRTKQQTLLPEYSRV